MYIVCVGVIYVITVQGIQEVVCIIFTTDQFCINQLKYKLSTVHVCTWYSVIVLCIQCILISLYI